VPSTSASALRKKARYRKLYGSPRRYEDVVDITLKSDNPARSALHDELSNRALLWAANLATPRGLIGATEMEVNPRYRADAVAIGLLDSKYYRRYRRATDKEEEPGSYLIYDNLFIFETKVTRRDFISTFGKNFRQQKNRSSPIGSLHWIVAPKGLAKKEEVPIFWGFLEAEGKVLVERKKPIRHAVKDEIIGYVAHQLLWYGDKRTRRRYTEIRTCPNCESTYSMIPEQYEVYKTIPQCWKCGPTADW